MSTQWAAEACDLDIDPVSGARLTQLTSSGWTSTNIYCEQPYTSPDGNRIAITRYNDVSFDAGARLLVADLSRLKLTMIEAGGVHSIGNAAWSGQLHYTRADGSLWRLDLQTLEKRPVRLPDGVSLRDRGMSIAPDQNRIVYYRYVPGPTVEIVVLDLEAQRERVIHENPELTNAHVQFNPVHGRQILVQHNRGSVLGPDMSVQRFVSEQGTTHFVLDAETGRMTPLPAGPPHTGTSTGHSNWVADTGRACWAAHWNLQTGELGPLNKGGNIHTATPGDAVATPLVAPEHRVNHVNVSRCGRYVVGDSFMPPMYDAEGRLRPPVILVGNLQTGKARILVSRIRGGNGGGQHQHLHCYFTADNRRVIYNDCLIGCPTQVWAAHMPEEFLASLG